MGWHDKRRQGKAGKARPARCGEGWGVSGWPCLARLAMHGVTGQGEASMERHGVSGLWWAR
jgi:hypothetical protein